MRLNNLSLLTALTFSVIVFDVSAQPQISGADTTNSLNGVLVIKGTGFGSGPAIKAFDDFEAPAVGLQGTNIPLNSAKAGKWLQFKTTETPLYDNRSHSGKYSARIFVPKVTGQPRERVFLVELGAGTKEVYMSYWVQIPPGTPPPSKNTLETSETFPDSSAWKFSWLFDGVSTGSDANNICFPTWVGHGASEFSTMGLYLSGNNKNITSRAVKDPRENAPLFANWEGYWWDWQKFMRLSVWIKADPNEPNSWSNSFAEIQILTQKPGVKALWTEKKVNYQFFIKDNFDSLGNPLPTPPAEFTHLLIPGWLAPESSNNTQPLYDDVYIAAGDNAVARVEIGDDQDYYKSKMLAVQIPTSWTDSEIAIDLRNGGHKVVDGKYLFVFDSQGLVNPVGYQIKIKPGAPPIP